jgi:lysophospholipase L1-like esterase
MAGAASVQAAAHASRPGAPNRGAPTAAGPILYALGDSTGTGVGARGGSYVERVRDRLEASGKGFRLQNLAQSGATVADVLHDQLARIPSGTSGLVLVGVGTNDLIGGLDPDAFGQRFEALLAGLRARTGSPIVVSNVPDVSLAPAAAWVPSRAALAGRIDAFNRVIAAVAHRHDAVVFDLCAFTRRELPRHPEYVSSDGFHPSDRGYQAWTNEVWRVIERAL